MTERPSKPFYLDVLNRKHEAFSYDESEAWTVEVDHQTGTIQLLMPHYLRSSTFRVIAFEGDYLFLIGEVMDETDEDGRLLEGGDGVMIGSRRVDGREKTYWTFAWHSLFTFTLDRLNSPIA